jgi:hypothetical protein
MGGVGEIDGGSAGQLSGAGQAGSAGPGAVFPICMAPGTPGEVNRAGSELDATETFTDWTLSEPVESLEWLLSIERDIEHNDPALSGYYFNYRFSFVEGVTGIFGIQGEGLYQYDPSIGFETTRMAVFWLSGPPLDAELGDIPYPDARVAPITANGVSWMTIHARFAWEVCHVYRFRVAPESSDAEGNTWYGGWIEDTTSGVTTFMGRMLLEAGSGLISAFGSSRVEPIEYGPPTCNEPIPASAMFSAPSGNDGTVHPMLRMNRFGSPLSCPTSRFTNFEGAVRHELGIEL